MASSAIPPAATTLHPEIALLPLPQLCCSLGAGWGAQPGGFSEAVLLNVVTPSRRGCQRNAGLPSSLGTAEYSPAASVSHMETHIWNPLGLPDRWHTGRLCGDQAAELVGRQPPSQDGEVSWCLALFLPSLFFIQKVELRGLPSTVGCYGVESGSVWGQSRPGRFTFKIHSEGKKARTSGAHRPLRAAHTMGGPRREPQAPDKLPLLVRFPTKGAQDHEAPWDRSPGPLGARCKGAPGFVVELGSGHQGVLI